MFKQIKAKWQKMSLTGRLVLTTALMFLGVVVAYASPIKVPDGLYMSGDKIDIVDVGRNVLASFKRTVSGGGNVELDLSTGRLQHRDWVTFTANDATPSVKFANHFKVQYTAATTITALDDCENGQDVMLVFNNTSASLADAATLHLAGAFSATAEDTISLSCSTSGNAYETSRSIN